MSFLLCPYCEEMNPPPDCDHDTEEIYKCACEHCNKTFEFQVDFEPIYYASKLEEAK